MTEAEAMGICKNIIRAINGDTCYFNYSKEQDKEAIETLLEMYNKQKQELDSVKEIYYTQSEVEQLANGIRVLGTNPDITTEEIIKEFTENPISEEYMEKFKSSYISKDEVLKAMGYEENDEEYDRIKQDDEKLLGILDTMYSEFCRLEDIEDKKVEVAVSFIEEKRDKHWKDKIEKELLEPINKERQETYKDFMKKGKDDYHGVEGSVLQELNWVVGTIEELLGE